MLSFSESATEVPSSPAAHMAADNVTAFGVHSGDTTTTEGSRCFTEEDVILLTRDLYGHGDVAGASRLLSQFQTRPEAWSICLRLVLCCAPCRLEDKQAVLAVLPSPTFETGSELRSFGAQVVPEEHREVLAFFAAQTICVLCESGAFEKVSGSTAAQDRAGPVQRILAELLWCYRDVQLGPVGRQLASAVAAAALFEISAVVGCAPKRESGLEAPGVMGREHMASANGSGGDGTAEGEVLVEVCARAKAVITALLQAYGNRSSDLFSVLLEILTALPVAVDSPRLALSPNRRQMAAFGVLSQAFLALGAACEMQRTAMRLEVSVCPRDFLQLRSVHERGRDVLETRASQEVRLGALRCYEAWLDALTRYHKVANDAQQKGKLTSESPTSCISGSARLLLCTPVVPLVLLNFLWECQRIILCDDKKSGTDACEVPGLERHCNTGLVAELEDMQGRDGNCGTGANEGSLLRTSCDTAVAVLDYLYALYSIFPVMLVPSAETEGEEMLALINWTNVDILRCMFYVASSIEALLHRRLPVHISGTGSYRQPDMTALRLIPTGVVKIYTLFLGKLVEIFLPAFIYSMQFDTLNDGLLLQPQEAEDALHDAIAGMTGLPPVTPPQAPKSEERETTLRRSEALLQLMTDLLFHPALELRYLILEFWFSLTGNQFVQQQAQLETAAEQSAQALGYDQTERLSLILPAFHGLVDTLVVISAYPSDITRQKDNFPFTAWLKFRDECSISLVDISAVLSSYSIVEKAGGKLLKLLEGVRKAAGSVPLTAIPELWRDIEVCLFILTSVAPRAPVGEDQYIPMALEALPLLEYPQDGSLEALIMNTAAASLILWSAGYIGTRRELFASCFRLLRCFLHALRSGSGPLKETASPNSWPRAASDNNHSLLSYCDYCERVMVEALNAAVTAVAPSLTRDPLVPEADVTYVLNGLADLILIETLTMESRCSLVVSAGAVLQCLSLDKMQKYHYQLCDALHSRVLAGLPGGAAVSSGNFPKLSVETIQCLKLFFTALESVNPVYYVPLPPFSPNAAPLEPSSDYRHPVLNVVEEFWPLFRRCLLEFHASEMLIESTCHCVVQTFHLNPVHVVRYGIFGDFLEVLAASFIKTPSIFHLAALRSMLGIFGMNREEPVIRQLNDSLLTCTTYVLNAMQMTGVRVYVEQSPDVVGMILDCLNTALGAPGLTAKLMGNSAFSDALTLAISLTPECSHPKVLMTMLLLMTRFASFLDPGRAGQPVTTGSKTTGGHSTLEAERRLAVRQLCFQEASRLANQLGIVEKMIHSALRAVTETYQGNIQWLGLVGTLFVDLLRNPPYRQTVRQEIKSTLERAPSSIVPHEAIQTFSKFLDDAEKAAEHRSMCEALQQLAEQCSAHWQQSQFCSGKNESANSTTNPPVAWA